MKRINLNSAVTPIFRGTSPRNIIELLGTGFYTTIDGEVVVVTASHVFEKNPLNEDECYIYASDNGSETRMNFVTELKKCSGQDVTYFPVVGDMACEPLSFSNQTPALNNDVFCYEFSQYSKDSVPGGAVRMRLEPFAHKGNIMQQIDDNFPPFVSAPYFVVSFPALKGASGSPLVSVTSNDNFYIAGMMVANVGRHLVPAQVEKIVDSETVYEEVSYYLPLGLATQGTILKDILGSVGTLSLVE